ncbi:MAG TPA: glycosyltransferase, partial [Myxococcaceae bacterium]|nr:glycosyltransferase [Myxococcaceae bacterium]
MLETHNLKGGDAARHAAASLERLLAHLRKQALPLAELDELIITHQGLSAADQERIQSAAGRPIQWCLLPAAAGYYQGKNAGFDASAAEVVVFGDSDCWPDDGWLENLVSPFMEGAAAAAAVAGRTCYRPGVLGSAASSIDFNYYPSPLGPGCTRNFYANNVAFRREVFAEHRYGSGEHFYRGNCQTLGLRLGAAGIPVRFEPRARTTHRFPDSWAELVRLRLLRGGDLAELSPRLLSAHLPGT